MERPESICPVPWQNLSLDVDGSSRPCCKFAHHDDASRYRMANLKDAPLDEVWNSDGMQRLRRDFLAGERPAECSTCWDEEDAGIRSLRVAWREDRHLRAEPDFDDLTPAHPVALDLKLTNVCNLKCRICGPVASSLWLQEELEIAGDHPDPYLVENRLYFRANKITRQDTNAAVFAEWLPHLEHVELTGGEPMMSPENRQVVESLVEQGEPGQVALLVTTNATVIDERITGTFPRFGSVTVSLSIDDIGERLAYERAPSDWPSVEANIVRYAEMSSPTCQIYLNTSVSTLNVWYLPEFLDWVTGDERFAPIGVHLNLVHNARHFNIRALPPAAKAAVRTRLEGHLDRSGIADHLAGQVREVLDFMDADQEPPEVWAAFLEHTHHRDRVRDERFAEAFADWHAELDRVGAWADAPSPSVTPVALAPRRPGLGRRARRLAGPVARPLRRLLRA